MNFQDTKFAMAIRYFFTTHSRQRYWNRVHYKELKKDIAQAKHDVESGRAAIVDVCNMDYDKEVFTITTNKDHFISGKLKPGVDYTHTACLTETRTREFGNEFVDNGKCPLFCDGQECKKIHCWRRDANVEYNLAKQRYDRLVEEKKNYWANIYAKAK